MKPDPDLAREIFLRSVPNYSGQTVSMPEGVEPIDAMLMHWRGAAAAAVVAALAFQQILDSWTPPTAESEDAKEPADE